MQPRNQLAMDEMSALLALHEALARYCRDEERFGIVAAYLAPEHALDMALVQAQGWGLVCGSIATRERPKGPSASEQDHVYYDELAFKFGPRYLTLSGGVEDEARLHHRLMQNMLAHLRKDNLGCQYARVHTLPADLPVLDELSAETQQAAEESVRLITIHVQTILLQQHTLQAKNAKLPARL
jgi:hypothetical protein